MRGLYKGRYLIAVYDKYDCYLSSATRPCELSCYTRSLASQISRMSKKGIEVSKRKRIYLIDCLKNKDDVFAEEDKLFLDEIRDEVKTDRENAVRLGVSERTYYRHKANNTLYKLENRLKEK